MNVSSDPLPLGPDVRLSCEAVEAAAHAAPPSLRVTDAGREALRDARSAFESVRDAGVPIYGVTTGFGPFVDQPPNDTSEQAHGHNLLAHLGTGAGPLAGAPVVRAMIVARLQSLVQGHSGIRLSTVETICRLLEANLTPVVPEVGSLGASGDLTPLAHAALAYTGSGRVLNPNGEPCDAATALDRAGLGPLSLDARDALALVNGTSFTTGIAALATARTRRLLDRAEALTGWAYQLLGCSLQPLDDRLHAARGHTGQVESAAAIRTAATRSGSFEASDRPLQEPYSLRTAPQMLGAVRDHLSHARSLVETELNGADDNPIVDPEEPAVLHGGNFQGQQVAFAADALNEAATQMGVLAERQLDLLLSPDRNGGAPALLAWQPGPTSGFAGAQLTATALVSELRQNAQMAATSSIPTNQNNQDVVSMGALAARTARDQTERLAPILAVVGMALAQLTHLRRQGRADGPAPDPPRWMPSFDPVVEDRPLHDEIDRLATRWLLPSDA